MITDNLVETVMQVAMRKVQSGGVEIADFEDNFLLPKIVLFGTLKEVAENYKPRQHEHLLVAENLRCF